MRSKWIISLVLVLTLIIGLVPIGQPVYAVGTGEFLVSDYGTGLDAYYRWYRGYIFQVTEETKVTALVGGGNGGIFGGGIYTIENVNGVIKPKELLGSVAFTGTTPDQVAAFIGKDYVTLFPGTDYLIVSGRQSPGGDGEPLGYVIENINVSDLESNSTRIKEGTWFPRDNNKAVQFKYYDVAPSGLIGKIHSLTDNLPRLGFQYETNFDKPAIATLEPEVTSSGVTLRGQLENTGGTETTVFFEWGTEHDLSTSGCFVPADAQTVTESVYTHEITDIADGEYCYRVVAINEAGRVEGIIKDFEIVSDAAYTVEHYQQDVTGDGYTLAEKEEKTGTVDTSVTAVAKTYIGFSENTSYGDRIVNGNILPDGSLVLKLYYDRDIFTVTFKDYNGNDLKKESVRYGGAATPPVAPTMEGYISTGWDKAFDNITSDMEIRAQYKVLQYTVNFESNGGSTVDPIAGDYGTTINKPTAPTKEGYIFEGWYKDIGLINQWDFENDKVPAKNIVLYAKYQDETTFAAYTVEHYQQDVTGDGYTLAEKEEKTGKVDTSVTAVAKTYIGFSENTSYGDRIVNGNILPDGSLVLKLYYDRDIFTVTFKDYNGNDLKKESVRYGGAATPPVAPTMEGYISTGWDKAFDNITSDMEIRAQYQVLQYTVSFESNGGSTVDPIAGDYGTTINKPTAPTKEGYIFEGWYKDSELINQWDFENDKVPAKNITLFAKYHCISSDTRKPAKREQSKSREDINVIVDDQKNNKDVNISDERETLTIQIDSNEPKQIRTQLTGNIVKRMEQEKQILIIKTGDVKYSIPAKEITIDAVAKTLGVKSDSLEDIVVDIMITKVDEQKKAEIIKNAATGGYEILVHPEQFKIFAKTESKTGETKEITVSNFTTYVSRILEIPANIDPEKVTTGIIYNGDGVFSHIPTSVFQDDGKWYAKLNSLTNSIYSVVWNPVYVETVESHWSKEAVNDMASRLVIKAPESFHPDKEIARGEFAEIITKAIGIYRTQTVQENQFSDVTVTNELGDAITIAVDYGIMTGYTDGTFRPDAQITREEAMVMYARAMDIVRLEEIDNDRIETYRDKGQISVWTYDAVKKVINSGVFNGTTENTIAPKRTLTCAEAATAIRNLLIKSKLIND